MSVEKILEDIKVVQVSRKSFADAKKLWPLTIDRGLIAVRLVDNLICFIEPGGKLYALNGAARMTKAMAEIDPIWAKSIYTKGGKQDLSDLINVGVVILDHYKEKSAPFKSKLASLILNKMQGK